MLRPKAPVVMQVELTERCNHQCSHCYQLARGPPVPKPAADPLAIAARIIEADVFHVTLSGGEPLLTDARVLEDIISSYADHHVTVGFNSNITLVTPEHCRMFARYGISVLTSVISHDEQEFDATTRTPGSYQRFVRAAEMLRASGVRVSGNMVVTRRTVGAVYQTGRFVADLGFRGFNATRNSPAAPAADEILTNRDTTQMLDQLLAVKRDLGLNVGSLNALPYCSVAQPERYREIFTRSCVAGLTTAGIGVNGEVRACQHFSTAYGNVLEEPLSDIWSRMPVWKRQYDNHDCIGCVYKERCGGGCRENARVTSGRMDGEDSLKRGGSGRVKARWADHDVPAGAIVFEDGLRIRDEPFGGIIFKTPVRYVLADHFTCFFVKAFYRQRRVCKDELLALGHTTPEHVDAIFANLVRNQVAKTEGEHADIIG